MSADFGFKNERCLTDIVGFYLNLLMKYSITHVQNWILQSIELSGSQPSVFLPNMCQRYPKQKPGIRW